MLRTFFSIVWPKLDLDHSELMIQITITGKSALRLLFSQKIEKTLIAAIHLHDLAIKYGGLVPAPLQVADNSHIDHDPGVGRHQLLSSREGGVGTLVIRLTGQHHTKGVVGIAHLRIATQRELEILQRLVPTTLLHVTGRQLVVLLGRLGGLQEIKQALVDLVDGDDLSVERLGAFRVPQQVVGQSGR